MLEAFNLISEFAVEELNVKGIIGKTLTINKQAIRLVERTGFNALQVVGDETTLTKTYR